MAIKVLGKYTLSPNEAIKIEMAYRQTKKMIGTVTRRQVRNMYLEKKYGVENPDKMPEQVMPESAPQVSVAPVSEFAPFGSASRLV